MKRTPLTLPNTLALSTARIFGFVWTPDNEEDLRDLIRQGEESSAARHDRFLSRYCQLFQHVLGPSSEVFPNAAIHYATLAGNGKIDWRMAVDGFNIDRQPRGQVVHQLFERWETWVVKRLGVLQSTEASMKRRERFCKCACAMFLAIEPFEVFNSRIMMLIYFTLRQRLQLPLMPIPLEESKAFFKVLSEIRRKYIVPYFRSRHLLTQA